MSTWGLGITDWLALIFGALVFFILLWTILPRPGRGNHVSIGKENNAPIYIDQSDRSQRSTQINSKVNVRVNMNAGRRQESQQTPTPTLTASRSGSGDSGQAFALMAAGVALFGVAVYLQHFEVIVLATRAFFLGLLVYGALGLLAVWIDWIEPVNTEYRWFAAHVLMAVIGVAILLNGQALIDPNVQVLAQQAPLSLQGVLQVMAKLTWPQRFSSLASFIMCIFTMLLALQTALAIWRTYIVTFWGETDHGLVARLIVRFFPRADEGAYWLRSGFLLVMALLTRYLWLPHALQAT